MLKKSLRLRLVALFVFLFGSTLTLFTYILAGTLSNVHQREFDNALYNYTIDVAQSIKFNVFGDVVVTSDFLKEKEKVFPFSLERTLIILRGHDGQVFARSNNSIPFNVPFSQMQAEEVLVQGATFQNIYLDTDGNPATPARLFRLLSYKVNSAQNANLIIQTASPMTLLDKERKEIVTFFLISIPVVLLLSTIAGLVFTKRALRPVLEITEKANSISADQLSERVPVPQSDTEMRGLAITINNLLARLEKAFQSQERFVADASHQIKTPLAILKGEIDVMLSRARSTEEMKAFLNSASEEISLLSSMVENLLLLARVEAGVESFIFKKIRLDEVVTSVVARLEKIARLKDIQLKLNLIESDVSLESIDSVFEINGEEELLKCQFFNLIENAIKYSPNKSVIEIRVKNEGEYLIVEIEDHGPGIKDDEKEKIFQRFYRAKLDKQVEGSGLGLAVAHKIAQIHKATLTLNDSQPSGVTAVFKINVS